jgi:hypothetical protein
MDRAVVVIFRHFVQDLLLFGTSPPCTCCYRRSPGGTAVEINAVRSPRRDPLRLWAMRTLVVVLMLLPSARADRNNCAAGEYLTAELSVDVDVGDGTECLECPPNTYSASGAYTCTACEASLSSPAGSTKCTASEKSRGTMLAWILCVLSLGVLARLVSYEEIMLFAELRRFRQSCHGSLLCTVDARVPQCALPGTGAD